jgi:hypothetical protein
MLAFHRKDSGAFGVRLGPNLRAEAEREASRSKIPLSRWVKRLVERSLSGVHDSPVHMPPELHEIDGKQTNLDATFEKEWNEFLGGHIDS